MLTLKQQLFQLKHGIDSFEDVIDGKETMLSTCTCEIGWVKRIFEMYKQQLSEQSKMNRLQVCSIAELILPTSIRMEIFKLQDSFFEKVLLERALLSATAQSDVVGFKAILDSIPSSSTRQELVTTRYSESKHGNVSKFRRRIDEGYTCLHLAAACHLCCPIIEAVLQELPSTDSVRQLINSKADGRATTALMVAAQHGNVEAVRCLCEGTPLLLEKFAINSCLADVNAASNGEGNALLWAVVSRNKQCCQLLIRHGAQVTPEIAQMAKQLIEDSSFL